MLPPAPMPAMILLAALAVAMSVRPPLDEPMPARSGDVPVAERAGSSMWGGAECQSHARWSRFYGKCIRDNSL